MDKDDNETRRLIADAVARGDRGVVLDCNPAFAALAAILLEGNAQEVVVQFTAGKDTTQGNGVVGGGTIANMLDSAMAVAVLSQLGPGQTCSTITLNVNMLRPALSGRLRVRASIEKLGARVAFAHARLLDDKETALATATSSLAIVSHRAAPSMPAAGQGE